MNNAVINANWPAGEIQAFLKSTINNLTPPFEKSLWGKASISALLQNQMAQAKGNSLPLVWNVSCNMNGLVFSADWWKQVCAHSWRAKVFIHCVSRQHIIHWHSNLHRLWSRLCITEKRWPRRSAEAENNENCSPGDGQTYYTESKSKVHEMD